MCLRDGRVFPPATAEDRFDPGRRRALCRGGKALPGVGTVQRLLQERLYPCDEQGCAERKGRGGPLRDDGREDHRDRRADPEERRDARRRDGAQQRDGRIPEEGIREADDPQGGDLLRGAGRGPVGARQRDGTSAGSGAALPEARGFFLDAGAHRKVPGPGRVQGGDEGYSPAGRPVHHRPGRGVHDDEGRPSPV